ncbi:sigma-70 family RNA polymerase sigma factor [Actinokineospora sp. PR83]|uniref:sigma-70 family RNA polymerase sigma factor n=1 Tax=Actinokineospora sp. PR83 TaxID=2884908 RepID=UPI001F37CF35|nr:sigma-70 family RNA polymerase sigma factor [Actinokineospora sp. PR83]MCG8919437.1 sigma-70 family RNA polymerase sigma factor [Actinokineospora sp. PR83]
MINSSVTSADSDVGEVMQEVGRGVAASITPRLDVDAALRDVQAAAAARLTTLSTARARVAATTPPTVPGPQGHDAGARGCVAVAVREQQKTALPQPTSGPSRVDVEFARLTSTTFDELVTLSRRGDKEALSALFAWLGPPITRYCRAHIGRSGSAFTAADDLAQETMIAVLRALPSFRGGRQEFLPFVFGIAAHKLAEHQRHRGNDRADSVAAVPDVVDDEPGPEQTVLRREMRNRMDRLLAILTPRQREIIVLRVVVGFSAAETANVIGLSAAAVRICQHRAMNRLRKALVDAAVDGVLTWIQS